MNHKGIFILFLALLVFLLGTHSAVAQGPTPRVPRSVLGTAFTYQGQIKNNGAAYTGACDIQFKLFDTDTVGTGTQVGSTQTATNVSVANGLFTTQVDFGANAFNGEARWLEIGVRCPAASGSYISLPSRQALTPTPYALYSQSTGALRGNGVSAAAPSTGQVLQWNGSMWSPWTMPSNWSLTGNAGSNPAANFLGTTDNMSFTIRVSNTVAYRVIPSTNPSNSWAPILIGGASANSVSSNLYGATIAGGGDDTYPNVINTNGRYAAIGGGYRNTASGLASTVPGGYNNQAQGSYSFAAGDQANAAHSGAFVWADASGVPFASTNSNQFLIRANGGVGINTNQPARTLEVNGSVGLYDSGGRYYYAGMATESGSQMINFGMNEDGGNRFGGVYSSTVQGGMLRVDTRAGYNLFTFYGRPAASPTLGALATLNSAGKFWSAGGFNGQCLSAGSFTGSGGNSCNMDIAEGFRATQLTAPGDLVALETNGTEAPTVRKSSNPYDGLVIGVVSDNPGLVFDNGATHLAGDNSKLITNDRTIVALVGRVNVKVSMENGAIHIGDPLASSSTPGVAMKATQAGKIIGYAMQAAIQDGLALALIQPGYYLPAEQVVAQNQNAQLEARLAALEQKAQSTNDHISVIALFILGGLMGIILAHQPWQIKSKL